MNHSLGDPSLSYNFRRNESFRFLLQRMCLPLRFFHLARGFTQRASRHRDSEED